MIQGLLMKHMPSMLISIDGDNNRLYSNTAYYFFFLFEILKQKDR
nr:MAG TPA: hypothetical protein [Caudoviricetes sp.]